MSRMRLLWLVVTISTQFVSAHPTRGIPSRADKRAALLDTYRFNIVSTYITLDQNGDVSSSVGLKRDDHDNTNSAVPYYVQAATSQVREIVPGASFRIAQDYYVGTNKVGHVHFQQVIDGIDVDTAYFKVNVGRRVALWSLTRSYIPIWSGMLTIQFRFWKMGLCCHSAIPST